MELLKYVEIIAVIFSLTSVLLTIKNNILCWPFGIVGIVFYMILFYQNRIYGNMILQFLFIGQSILGWYNWKSPSKYPIKWIKKDNRESVFGITALISVLFILITKHHGGSNTYFDGVTTGISISAMLLMSYRKVDSWLFWIVADVVFIWFFLINGLYLSSLTYLVFLILSIVGFFEWKKKSIKTD